MAVETERLLVNLEARIAKFERDLRKAGGTADKEFAGVERRAAKAAQVMESRMGGMGASIAAGLKGAAGVATVAAAGIATAVTAAAALAKSMANVGNEARRAGLSTKAFQELSHVADQNRISMDALVDGMKELALRADEYIVTGAGSAAEAFQRLGFTATDLKQRLKDPSALLVEIVKRTEELGDTAAGIRLFDELFGGTGGEQFVELLNRGSVGIRQMIQDANDFGLVLDEAMIKRADEIDRKFGLLVSTVGTGLKGAILDATEALTGFLDQFNDVGKQQAGTLQASIERNLADMKVIRDQIAALQSQQNDSLLSWLKGGNDPQIRILEAQLAKIQADDQRLRGLLRDRAGGQVYGPVQPKPAAAAKPLSFTPLPSTTAKPADILSTRLAPGKNREHVDGLASDLKEALNKALAAAPESVRNATTLNSGYRSFERQAQLFAEAVKKYGSPEAARKWVAPPGKSQHQDGEAADLGFGTAEARRWFHDNAASFGLTFPMGHEPWHVETTGARRKVNDEAFRERYEAQQGQSDAYADIIAGATDNVAAQNLEAQALKLTTAQAAALRYEQDLLNQATQAGIELTPERIAQLQMLAGMLGQAEAGTIALAEANANAQDRLDEWRLSASDLTKGFIADLRAGKTEAEAFGNVLASLADKLIDAGLDMALSGLFGKAGTSGTGLLGGVMKLFGFAKGGIAAGGKPQPLPRFAKGGVSRSAAVFGEAGPEAAVPLPDGRRIPVDLNLARAGPNLLPASSRSMTFAPVTTIDARGSTVTEARMRAIVEESQRKTLGQVRDSVSGWVGDDNERV